MKIGNPGEFVYYLDNPQALELLIEQGWSERDGLPFEDVRNNKDYSATHDPSKVDELQGRLLFLKHELMISRFHAMRIIAARKLNIDLYLCIKKYLYEAHVHSLRYHPYSHRIWIPVLLLL